MLSLIHSSIALLLGCCIPLWLPHLPAKMQIMFIIIGAVIGMLIIRSSFFKLLCISILGFGYFSWQAQNYLTNRLEYNQEKQKITIKGKIVGLVEEDIELKKKFLFKPDNCYGLIQLSWQHAPFNLKPGDVWQLTVKLKRPRAYANPGSFDSEKYALQNRIIASGYVIEDQNPIFITHGFTGAWLSQIRQILIIKINGSVNKFV